MLLLVIILATEDLVEALKPTISNNSADGNLRDESNMGLLVEGKPLTPEELKNHIQYIKEHGITQFLNTWNRLKDLQNDKLRFGDEIECGILAVDRENKTIQISVRSAEVKPFSIYYLKK